jgi:ubiquinone/menaquinone biosynthesis C-methylase UbiE
MGRKHDGAYHGVQPGCIPTTGIDCDFFDIHSSFLGGQSFIIQCPLVYNHNQCAHIDSVLFILNISNIANKRLGHFPESKRHNGTIQNGAVVNKEIPLWTRLVRCGFRLLYQEFAWTYDLVSWLVSLGEWRHWQRAGIPYMAGRCLLEVGHGPGHMLAALSASNVQIYGVDYSAQMGRIAGRRLLSAGDPARLARGKVQALPFKAATFDAILSTFPTEFIVDPQALAEFGRVLRRDGRLVIVPEGHLTGQGPLRTVIKWAFRVTGQRSGPFAVDATEMWPAHSVWGRLQELFQAAGFTVTAHQLRRPRSRVTVLVAEKAFEVIPTDGEN